MVKPSDSNADSYGGQDLPSATDAMTAAQQELQRGVAALKAKDYAAALAIFRQLEQTAQPFKTKARMGMVQAYQQSGNIELAREKCQELLTNSSTKVCQWAQQALAKLPPPDEASQQTPSSIQNPLKREDKSVLVPEDKSGFVPLEQSSEEQGETTPPLSMASSADTQAPSFDREAGLTPIADGESVTETGLEPDLSAQSEAYQSLFHYQQLNQQAGASVEAPTPNESTVGPSVQATASSAEAAVRPSVQPKKQPRQKRLSGSPPTSGLEVGRPYRLWLVQGVTAIATLWLIHWGVHQGLQLVNDAIRFIRWPIRLRGFYAFERPHFWLVVMLGISITLASPWLLDRALAFLSQQKSLSSRQLQAHCPNALRLMRRVCRQRGWQMPELRTIPDPVPLCFSYGWSPRTVRIVISQGLLDALEDEELTVLYANELAHIANWDLPVLSGLSVLLLMFYSGYWHLSQWGDRRRKTWLKILTGIIASLLYGTFWLLRKLGLWLSRVRGAYCDRTSLAMTRQPELHQRLLLKLTRHIPQDVNQRGYLHPLLVSLDLLMPLSPNQAVSPGSFLDQVSIARLIAEDCLNPYRYWLLANSSHGVLGERLLFFEQWANYWKQPSLGVTMETVIAEQPEVAPSRLTVRDLVLQNSPLLGFIAGGGIALALWFIGGVVNRLNWQQVSWLYQDASILKGGLLIGLGMGILVRINPLFPEVRRPSAPVSDIRSAVIRRQPVLPVKGEPLVLQGTLVGSEGLTNSVGNQMYLREDSGLLRLKATSPLDWWRGLLKPHQHPVSWLGRQVVVTGWQRRGGGLLWFEVASIQPNGKPTYRAHAPQWATGLGIVISLWGIWTIWAGG